jgi:hypothetical protein
MQATIKINESEFDWAFVKRLKKFAKGYELVFKIDTENIELKENIFEFSKNEFMALETTFQNTELASPNER